ncbi:MAG: metal-dependent hydrolase [archaeon GB-1845-036]|nr:metal-dependent hydrolase [Candidatus Culexmicrobium thermophilum]
MKLKWLSHAGFLIEIDEKRLLIDPWIKGNPLAKCTLDELDGIDAVLVTHDHSDHMGDAIEIAIRNNAKFIGIYELSQYAAKKGVKNVVGMNIGGTINLEGLSIIMVQAFHSSNIGMPTGYIIREREGVYHAGDTGLFYDMKLLAELYKPRVVLLPIGGHFTMGLREAAEAVKLMDPEIAIPMHYNTFPPIVQDPNKFREIVKEKAPRTKVIIAEINEWIEI